MYRNLKALRQSLNMSQKEFAASLGIGYTTYNGYETGARDPKSDFWITVAEKYGVTIDYLMGFSDDPHGYVQVAANEPISEDERQKRLDQLAGEIRDEARRLKTIADSTYDFFSSLGSLVGLSIPIPHNIIFRPHESEAIEKVIKSLVENFLESANEKEKEDFWLRYDKIGKEFRERIDHPERTPYPSSEELDILVGSLMDEQMASSPEDD